MIPQSVIKRFLNAKRDDHRYLKKLRHKELDALLAEFDLPPKYNPKLGLHQKVGLYLGIKYGSFAYFYDMGCVDGETEYLTPSGWKRIDTYNGGVVAQYDPASRTASFVEPLDYIDQPCDFMRHFKSSRGCDQMVSLEHNMLVVGSESTPGTRRRGRRSAAWKHTPIAQLPEYESKGWATPPCFYKVKPDEIVGKPARIETTFLFDGPGIALTDAQIRLQVAVHADGYLPNSLAAIISVKKERKKVRARFLLRRAGIAYKETARANGYSIFRFEPPVHTKRFGADWWETSLQQKQVICDEVQYWDGSSHRSGGISFFSRSKSCADFIQFCFVSTRRRSFVGASKLDEQGKIDYTVHAIGSGRTGNLANLRGGGLVAAPGGRKYCFEVPTHYLVLRRSGNIFVTGNTGKTLLSLELLQYWWDIGELRRALVFVTSDKAFPTWERQHKQYKINVPYCSLDATSSEAKWKILDHFDEGIIFLHYPGTVAMVSGPSKKKKNKMALVPKLVDRLLKNVDAAIFDEATKTGNIQSLTYKICRKAALTAMHRAALAGMPFGRDPTPLWPQMFLVDHGETLGETIGLFRAAFFNEEDNYWSKNPYAKNYNFKKVLKPKLSQIIQHSSLTYTADECIDVPKFRRILEMINLTSEIKAYYNELVEEAIAARGNKRVMENAFLRMRQLSSGFIGLKDDETGEKTEIEFSSNPKLERLLDILDVLPENRKALVFYQFTVSGRRIAAEIKKELKTKPIWLWSGTKNPREEMRRFMEDEECRYAVVNNQVGAYSLDGLQVANYEFFFESPLSVIDRSQAEKRIVRQGQLHKSFLYDLVVRGTVDERILEFHQEGRDLFKALLTDPARVLKGQSGGPA